MANMLDCNIIVSKFERLLHSHNYLTVWQQITNIR